MEVFNHCIIRNNLVKSPQKGPRFTWTNNRKGGHVILEKLDMAFRNSHQFDIHPLTHINNQVSSASDYSPIVLSTSIQNTPKKQLKFEPFWYQFPDFLPLLRTTWNSSFRGSPSFVLDCKLKSTLSPFPIGVNRGLVTSSIELLIWKTICTIFQRSWI